MGISVQRIDRYYMHNGAIYGGTGVGYHYDDSGVQYPDNWGTNDRITIRTDDKGASKISITGLALETAVNNLLYLDVTASPTAHQKSGGNAGVALGQNGSGSMMVRLEPNTTYYVWLYCVGWSHRYNDTGVNVTAEDLSMTLSISPTSLSTGGTLSLTIGNAGNASLTASVTHGSKELLSQRFTGSTTSFLCPKDWFDAAGITTDKSMTLSITVTGGPNTMTGSFVLNAGADMNPSVESVSVSIVQPSRASAYPSTWISNISSAKIQAKVKLNSAAAVASVNVSYGGAALKAKLVNGSYEATTEAPITGNTTFTVTVTDNRGLSGSKSQTLSGVVAYSPPTVAIQRARREDSDCYVLVAETHTSALTGNTVTIQAGPKGGTLTNIQAGSEVKIPGLDDPNENYTLLVTIEDRVGGKSSSERRLEGKLRVVVVKRSGEGTYVGIGTTPETTSGKSTLELPAGARILIGGVDLMDIIKGG